MDEAHRECVSYALGFVCKSKLILGYCMHRRLVPIGVIALLFLAVLAFVPPFSTAIRQLLPQAPERKPTADEGGVDGTSTPPELRGMANGTVVVPRDVVAALGIRTARASEPTKQGILTLAGSLALDPDRLAHVHTRFEGEVVELGTIEEPARGTNGGQPATRTIRFGDHVEKGQLLAVLWSNELGEKKSEYVDALSRLRLDRETLARLEKLYREDAVAERNLREARRNVESSEIAVARVERTLRTWRLSEDEISRVQSEADRIQSRQLRGDDPLIREWARVELRAPFSGTILEKNLAVGDIVNTQTDLFKIADLGSLQVWAHVYEDDLHTLLSLPQPIRWKVQLKADPEAPALSGTIETIGSIIDPIQHTASVIGRIANPNGRLRSGEFVVATVDVPPPPDVVEIPIDALVEDGRESVVFVQPERDSTTYRMCRVRVVKRFEDRALVRGLPESPGAPDRPGAPHVGDEVVVSGAVELWAAASRGIHQAELPTPDEGGSPVTNEGARWIREQSNQRRIWWLPTASRR